MDTIRTWLAPIGGGSTGLRINIPLVVGVAACVRASLAEDVGAWVDVEVAGGDGVTAASPKTYAVVLMTSASRSNGVRRIAGFLIAGLSTVSCLASPRWAYSQKPDCCDDQLR